MSDFSPELTNKIQIDAKATKQAVDAARVSHHERLQRATRTPLVEYGFSSDEQRVQGNLSRSFRGLAQQSEGESLGFLHAIEASGVRIINDSKYNEYLRKLRAERKRFDPNSQETAAAYVTREDLMSFFEKFQGLLPDEVKYELQHAIEGEHGAIFLGKNPPPLVVWHEGAHAIQHREGWNAKTAGKAKTEVGVNIVLLNAYEQGLLHDVTAGDYMVTETGFADPIIYPNSGDIYKELEDFERNRSGL